MILDAAWVKADGGGDHGRSVADHVGNRDRLGGHESDRSTDDRWHDFINCAHVGGDTRTLCTDQGPAVEIRHINADLSVGARDTPL